jgi:hypothetical protein
LQAKAIKLLLRFILLRSAFRARFVYALKARQIPPAHNNGRRKAAIHAPRTVTPSTPATGKVENSVIAPFKPNLRKPMV